MGQLPPEKAPSSGGHATQGWMGDKCHPRPLLSQFQLMFPVCPE